MTEMTDLTEVPSGMELAPTVTEGEGATTDTLINNVEIEEPLTEDVDTSTAEDTSEGEEEDHTEEEYLQENASSAEDDYINGVTSSTEDDYISDLSELKNQFPALGSIESITELDSPEEYLRFRSLGLTPREALLATGQSVKPSAPRRVTSPIAVRTRSDRIPDYYLKMAREIFGNLSDREIQALYKKVK